MAGDPTLTDILLNFFVLKICEVNQNEEAINAYYIRLYFSICLFLHSCICIVTVFVVTEWDCVFMSVTVQCCSKLIKELSVPFGSLHQNHLIKIQHLNLTKDIKEDKTVLSGANVFL